MNGYGHVWTEEKVRNEILKCMDVLMIDRFPTSGELKQLGRNDLHLKISRTRKYSGWASFMGLDRKDSDTLYGQENEKFIAEKLTQLGYKVERMSTKHPYDLLVNESVKIDVKSSKPGLVNGSRVHTFGLSKKDPTCDLYILIAHLDNDDIERIFVIPSHLLRIVTFCIGAKSKYNKFIDRWDYIEQYSRFLREVV